MMLTVASLFFPLHPHTRKVKPTLSKNCQTKAADATVHTSIFLLAKFWGKLMQTTKICKSNTTLFCSLKDFFFFLNKKRGLLDYFWDINTWTKTFAGQEIKTGSEIYFFYACHQNQNAVKRHICTLRKSRIYFYFYQSR